MEFPVHLPEEVKTIEHSVFDSPVKLGLLSWSFSKNK